ncbi:uncharacterized protein LOC133179710 [Saccostrea echinata]|uniref:uncharacterized protein LOC133179710 n=1 Tax=Saccostrea echinata TaxID=191078 RepID=UPI002A83E0C9|nr:uncharacterized protein LOC133179710 [Saccostrea echinata]
MQNMIPVVDLAPYTLSVTEEQVDTCTLRKLADEICHAFQDVGFVYLKNHGIPQQLINDVFSTSKMFFDQPEELKQKYAIPCGELHGYISFEAEKVNHDRPVSDAREGYTMLVSKDGTLPQNMPPEIMSTFKEIYITCTKLALRMLDLLSIGLDKDREYLRQFHRGICVGGNSTTLRSNYYPPIKEIKEGQARCGEHSDYGTITFLFQDDMPGLEAKSPSDEYLPVPPVEGTIVMNVGDMMQRWSADRLKATKHRVVVPQKDKARERPRQSIAVFVTPDDDITITCIDGSNKYPPIRYLDYLKTKIDANF